MSFYVDLKYLNILSIKLDNFKQKNHNLWNCRCPVCGDSKHSKLKSRGYFFRNDDAIVYKCHNCGYVSNIYKMLEQFYPSYTSEYLMEIYFEKNNNFIKQKKGEIKLKNTIPVFKEKLNLPSISSLNENHFAKKYVIDRKIPSKYYSNLYYSENFKNFLDEWYPEHNKKIIDNDARLVIPFFNKNNKIFMIQGRTLNNSKIKYISIKSDKEIPKIFGINIVDENKDIYVVEGPIDSLFLDNCIATADSSLVTAEKYFSKDKLILIWDNEPRNIEIVNDIQKGINLGFKVVIWPENFRFKDINEAIINGIKNIKEIIDNNIFKGLSAQLEFDNWRKI